MKIKFTNANIVTVNENFDVFFGDLIVENNIIVYVGKTVEQNNEVNKNISQIIDCKNNILMPGLINAHSHAPMTLFRGMGDEVVFEDWWHETMLPMEQKLTKKDIYNGAKIAVSEMLGNGITTFFDCYFHYNETIKAAQELGARVGIGFGAIKPSDKVTQKTLEKEYNILRKLKNVIPFLYAHSTYSCDEYQFAELLKFAKKQQLPFSTHVSETLSEVGEIHNKFGVTPVGLLESYGMFEVPCVLAHCVHCDKDDVHILKKYEVSISHNPASNLKLGSGIAPLYSFLKSGLNVCLGTDGAASNNNLDIFKEMYLAGNLQFGLLNNPKIVSAKELIKMATVNAAKAFCVPNLGVLAPGYLADIIMLNNNAPNMQPQNNLISNIVFSANAKNVVLTMVDGKVVYSVNF